MAGSSPAIVRPHVISPQTGEVLLLEDVVSTHRLSGEHGVVEIAGGPLMGKTTAIKYLRELFADDKDLAFVDEPSEVKDRLDQARGLIVSTMVADFAAPSLGKYRLAPWGQDEWIEYLLAVHKDRCASVIGRLADSSQRGVLEGNPGLWRMVLDDLAGNDFVPSAKESLRRIVAQHFSSNPECDALRKFALVAEAPFSGELDAEARVLAKRTIERPLQRLLALQPVRTLLAAEALVLQLKAGRPMSYLRRKLPYPLIREVASFLKEDELLQLKLHDVLTGNEMIYHAMAASLLHAADVGWKPVLRPPTNIPKLKLVKVRLPDLSLAYLNEANWSGIDFRDARLSLAKLPGANLEKAELDGAQAEFTDFSGATLRGASLARLNAYCAEFIGADMAFARGRLPKFRHWDLTDANLEGTAITDAWFGEADLTGTRFVRADLSRSRFMNADITDADFTQANLQGSFLSGLDLRRASFNFAIFSRATLQECNLEGMDLPGADFEAADLRRALLTGSVLARANLNGADLRGAGLADIQWEDVDLRDADLRFATFHLGSTRSGLVGSSYPSHGTRTGFYTDDYNEQDFKSPEEIRKANLCGADLRGANIKDVDFYLVDLRDARYDHEQEMHLRRCGAILKARAV